MRALVKKDPEYGIWIDDVPEPECDTNDVKIRVTHSAIFGTDLHIMLYDSLLAQRMAKEMLEQGIYVIGFYFPVVPKGKARIRVQISAAMTKHHLDKAIYAFTKVGKKLEII